MIPLNFLEHQIKASGSSLLKAEIIGSKSDIFIDLVRYPAPATPREIAVLVAFGAIDALIDCKIPGSIGDAFKSRAAALAKVDGVRKTLVGTYRLMIPVRNEFVHKSQRQKIEVNDEFWGKILNQVRLELIFADSTCIHAENFLAFAFEELKCSVVEFNDGAGDLPDVKAQIEYNPLFRARHPILLDGDFGEKIKRMSEQKVPNGKGEFVVVPDEYLIRGEFCQYLVPGEFFEVAAEIEFANIERWKVSNEFLAFSS
jgi:hypothetical protein